jgi:hypothetical protein
MIDRAIIMLTDHSGAVLLAPHRQVTRSIIGTPMAPAAASYRASGLVLWPIVLKSLFPSLLRLQLLLIRRNEGADFIRDV